MAATTHIISGLTHTTFHEFVRGHKFAVIHFWAAWNGVDIQMRRVIESELPEEFHQQVHFATFDIDPPEHHSICRQHKVMGPPFLAFYRDGNLVQTVVGLQKLEVLIQNLRVFGL